MLGHDEATVRKVEEQLRNNCPSPEDQLTRLSSIVADLPETQEGAHLRHLVLDIDDLTAQARWNLGQALLLMETQPHILDKHKTENRPEEVISEDVMTSDILLMLRGYIKEADRVLFSDLAEPRRSGTAAGWIFHMMIDNAIYRVLAILDRLAHILWYAAKLPTQLKNGEPVRVYFRSRKISKIDGAIGSEHSRALLEIAKGRVLTYAIGYRDGLMHDKKVYSKIAGAQPSDRWTTPDGEHLMLRHEQWEADLLFALGNATYHQLLRALQPAMAICEERL